MLERMSGPLCEAVLDLPGSAAALADLARSNLLLVPLDRRGQWYRYHHLFRDMLLAEAERLESGLIPVLRRRAAAWCLRNNLPEEALEYSMAAGDVDTVARLVEYSWPPDGPASQDRHLCSGGSGGSMTGAGSRTTHGPPRTPHFLPWRPGGRPTPSRWPMPSTAGAPRTWPGPATISSTASPLRCALCWPRWCRADARGRR